MWRSNRALLQAASYYRALVTSSHFAELGGSSAVASTLQQPCCSAPAVASTSTGGSMIMAAGCGAWGAPSRGYAADPRSAALQRLARASRHRAQRAADRTDKAAAVQEQAVVVTPSESKASESQVAQVVRHPALIITRPIEWGTVIFGYEQANRYQVLDQDGNPVAIIAEDFGGIGTEVGRQLLRTRRSFSATVFSADGSQVIFRVKRPAYLITSSMTIEDAEGNVVGEVHRRWSLLQRNYDLYLGKSQFAAIAGNFLAWEFELKDANGGTLAFIDRNFQGFGKEIFTDAGKYVIHFGLPADKAAEVASRSAQKTTPPVTSMALARTDVSVIPTATGNQLVVARPLQLDERMITLACAISIDYDFFSQHSHGGGVMGGMPIIPIPMPMPVPAGGDPGPEPGSAPGGPAVGAEAGAAGAAAPGMGMPGADPGQVGQAPSPTPPDAGEAGGWSEPQFGQAEQEIKWDDGVSSGGSGEGEGTGGIIGTIWGWVSGGD